MRIGNTHTPTPTPTPTRTHTHTSSVGILMSMKKPDVLASSQTEPTQQHCKQALPRPRVHCTRKCLPDKSSTRRLMSGFTNLGNGPFSDVPPRLRNLTRTQKRRNTKDERIVRYKPQGPLPLPPPPLLPSSLSSLPPTPNFRTGQWPT